MFTPETGLRNFMPKNLIYLMIPSLTIIIWRPSIAIPYLFHTGNNSSSNQFILLMIHV